jgi:hypothetical protein
MIVGLVNSAYLVSASLIDPTTKGDVCSGMTTGNPTRGGATYAYGGQVAAECGSEALTAAYQLTLTKESGGKVWFCSPK